MGIVLDAPNILNSFHPLVIINIINFLEVSGYLILIDGCVAHIILV